MRISDNLHDFYIYISYAIQLIDIMLNTLTLFPDESSHAAYFILNFIFVDHFC